MRLAVTALLLASLSACSGAGRPETEGDPARVRLWHTFNRHETEALNRALAERTGSAAVEVTLLPFARGMTLLDEVLRGGEDCPDLVRIDATWLPGLARAGLLAPAPARVAGARDWLPEAESLARDGEILFGLPQSLDGLALIHRAGALAEIDARWPPATVGDLERAARDLAMSGIDGVGVRVDGYWYVAFLRARGGDVLDPDTGALGIDTPVAARALDDFADLFRPGGVAPSPPAPGDEERDEVRRFRAGSLNLVVNGPWALWDLGGGATDGLEVTPFPSDPEGRPAAPRGGMVFVVPACAERADAGWALALDLTEPTLQATWSRVYGTVPTTHAALADAGELPRRFHAALARARPLPRHPATAEMFDDLTPAITAVVAGDATAEEALAGVARGWTRLLARHDIEALPPPPEAP